MDKSISQQKDLLALTSLMLDGTLDEQGHCRLKALLRTDSDRRRLYFNYVKMHVLLEKMHASPLSSDLPEVKSDSSLSSIERASGLAPDLSSPEDSTLGLHSFFQVLYRRPLLTSIITSFVFLFILTGTLYFQKLQNKSFRSSFQATQPIAARVLRNHKSEWKSRTLRPGSDLLVNDTLVLDRGFSEIRFENGAEITVHGQSTITMQSTKSCFLESGELFGSAKTPSSKGFTVRTPTVTLVDLGTEFSVQVDTVGDSLVRVFSGKVRLRDQHNQTVILTAGRSLAIGQQGVRSSSIAKTKQTKLIQKFPSKIIELTSIVGCHLEDKARRGLTEKDRQVLAAHGQARTRANLYSLVHSNPFIDGVFVPDGGEASRIQISSTGLSVDGIPDTNGTTYDSIRSGPNNSVDDIQLDGYDYAQGSRSFLSMHANVGITFDLDAFRSANPGMRIGKFLSRVGNSQGSVDFFVVVDGELAYEQRQHPRSPYSLPVEIEISDSSRFLTLITTDGQDANSRDWSVFLEPELWLFDLKKSRKTN